MTPAAIILLGLLAGQPPAEQTMDAPQLRRVIVTLRLQRDKAWKDLAEVTALRTAAEDDLAGCQTNLGEALESAESNRQTAWVLNDQLTLERKALRWTKWRARFACGPGASLAWDYDDNEVIAAPSFSCLWNMLGD